MMNTNTKIAIWVIAVVVLIIPFTLVLYMLGWLGEAARVTQEEFGAEASLTKYEWFINQANLIEKSSIDVTLYEKRVNDIKDEYIDNYSDDQSKWLLHIQMAYSDERKQARDDLLSVKALRNGLVRGYNTQSEKFNWKPFQTKPDKPKERYQEYLL